MTPIDWDAVVEDTALAVLPGSLAARLMLWREDRRSNAAATAARRQDRLRTILIGPVARADSVEQTRQHELAGEEKIAEIFGTPLNRKTRGKLATFIDRIEHGHHVFRAYFKNASLRDELVSSNLADFRLKKGPDHLDAVPERIQTVTGRFAGFQAQSLNVRVDFPLLQRLALPITVGAVRHPGIKLHDPRIIRLLEVLLHGGGGWTARQIHHAVLTTFHLSDGTYRLNQLRYDLRKLKGHALLQLRRDGSRFAYRLTPKGVQVACSSCSSTNDCAGRSPTAAFTNFPTSIASPPAISKPPTTAPIKPLNKSSIYLPPDLPVAICSTLSRA